MEIQRVKYSQGNTENIITNFLTELVSSVGSRKMTGQGQDAFWELSILKYSYVKIMLKNKDMSIKDI